MSADPTLPAFPQPIVVNPGTGNITSAFEYYSACGGITIRDYFAAKAMAALMVGDDFEWGNVAQCAYGQADAMLEARES